MSRRGCSQGLRFSVDQRGGLGGGRLLCRDARGGSFSRGSFDPGTCFCLIGGGAFGVGALHSSLLGGAFGGFALARGFGGLRFSLHACLHLLLQRFFFDLGRVMNVPPREQQAFLRSEIERWGALIKQYGVKAE